MTKNDRGKVLTTTGTSEVGGEMNAMEGFKRERDNTSD